MTDQNNNSPPNGPTSRRRSSFAGQAFADIFGGRNRSNTLDSSTGTSPPGQYSGPITTAAAQANQRRMSLSLSTSLGLGTSPPQGGSFLGGRARGESVSSSNNASVDESAVEEEPASAGSSQPTTPFARRVSFGARALRDMNKPAGNGNGGSNGNNGRRATETIPEEFTFAEGGGGGGRGGGGGKKGQSSPIDVAGSAKHTVSTTAKGRGESGFNWADNMRSRAERTSIGGAAAGTSPSSIGSHHRAKSIAIMEQPIREAPKPAPRLDHTQERILKGDFYMD